MNERGLDLHHHPPLPDSQLLMPQGQVPSKRTTTTSSNTHNTMTDPWPKWLVNCFLSPHQSQHATDESAYYDTLAFSTTFSA